MKSFNQDLVDLKRNILDRVASKGKEGIPESKLFKELYTQNQLSFNYKKGYTPENVLNSLLNDGYLIQVCHKEYHECRFIANIP